VQAGDALSVRLSKSGLQGRWNKDRGYVVSWHGSERAARQSADKPNGYDPQATVLGVFPVA